MADGSVTRTTVVVPCFNESKRLAMDAFVEHAAAYPGTRFLFVDDGSTDTTRTLLRDICDENPATFELLALDRNQGKAEAVRRGMLRAARDDVDFIGYWDADLATPLDELPRFRRVFQDHPHVEMVLGSRVNLLGRHVKRRLSRHYLSRAFATMVAAGLRLPVYDTQCGAKLFRSTPEVVALFSEPFHAKWIFDAELLVRAIEARGLTGSEQLAELAYELPLMRWHDVDGSKIRARHLLGSLRDASRIYAHHIAVRRWERGLRGTSEQVARATKDTLARITSERRHVGPIERTARASLLVPVFGFLVVWTRVRSWLIGPVQVSAETTHGAQFRCRLPDLIQTYLYLFGTWEPDQSCFARSRLRPGDTFVDVGANIGYYSILLQDVVGPDGAVVAFEASSTTMAHLETALAVNGARPWVRAVHTAVSDRHGEIVLYGGPVNNTGLSTSLATRGFAPEGKVRCAPLPDLLDPDEIATLRLLKIDVEGAEVAVLRGLEPLLKTAPDDIEILVELSPKWWDDPDLTPEHVLAPLIEAGFNVYSIDNDLWPWRYLWPNDLRPPRRVRTKLCRRPKRLDLVLSRVDAEELSMSASS